MAAPRGRSVPTSSSSRSSRRWPTKAGAASAAAVATTRPLRAQAQRRPRPDLRLRTRRSDLAGRTPNQVAYLKNILGHDITFGIGPAGTGKTYLAVACAVDALERNAVQRIILTRPAVEAGERLGFLPGDLAQKVDPTCGRSTTRSTS
jgi:phosphate starvation-inducible PhoH-like protein